MPASAWRTRLRSPWTWLTALAVLFPLLRLWPLNGYFATDWNNHQWLAAYTGEYFLHHGHPPTVINTPKEAGMAFPVFYGTLFYPIVSVLTAWMRPGLAVRIAIVLVTWLQLHVTTIALERYELGRRRAFAIACITIWATYPLTNLYNRSAITEYVATALLACTLALWFLILRARDSAERTRYALGCGLTFSVMAGTHPSTALYSLPFALLLVYAAVIEHGRDRAFWRDLARALAAPIAMSALVLGPWVYALATLRSSLLVSHEGGAWFYPAIDEWSTRFYPIPHDPRTADSPIDKLSTPYLDAQLAVPLLLLLVGWLGVVTWRRRSAGFAAMRAIVLPLAAVGFFLWISLDRTAYDHLPNVARMIQLAYRAITYQNLALLVAVVAFVGVIRRIGEHALLVQDRVATAVLIACVALAGFGVAVKLTHASAIMSARGPLGIRPGLTELAHRHEMPIRFYGFNNYTTATLFKPLPDAERAAMRTVEIPVGTGDDFGEMQPLDIDLTADAWLVTNAQAFAWNQLSVDGTDIPRSELRVVTLALPIPELDTVGTDLKLAVRVPAGHHTVELRTEPPVAYSILRVASFLTLVLWTAWLAFLTLRARRRARAALTAA